MMTQGGFYEQKRLSPTGVTIVVLLHAAAVAALVTFKMEMPVPPGFTVTTIKPIAIPPDPPPVPDKVQPRDKPQHVSKIDRVDPVIDLPLSPNQDLDIAKVDLPSIPWTPPGKLEVIPPPPPPPVPHEPIRTQPQIDGRSALQPPYPASAQREGAEGFVQVRVAIGPDGRVKAVEKVKASRDDFFAATERQALRYWRFKPATIDGKPIESSKVMSVTFKLDEMIG
jgi:protein TonB